MYNAFKFKKDQHKLEEDEAKRLKDVKLSNPLACKRKMERLSERSRLRREEWIQKVNFQEDQFAGKCVGTDIS